MKKLNHDKQPIDNEEFENKNERRTFLKKAVYTAPVLLALGQLAKPTKALADSGDPSGPPDWGGF